LRSFIPLHMRKAAVSPSRLNAAADFCKSPSSAPLCQAANVISKSLERAIQNAGKSAGCLAEWALRVCDDAKYERHW
jgi:hypothetical protein